jgi:phosphoribosylaminoimidazolecarboxamide formyltransferase/IMP cyclohydrolase
MNRPKTALISVSDKTGIVELAGALVDRGWEIVSTGGTAAELSKAGVPVRSVSELTEFPEMLAGRVKTLHPAVHAGILARRSVAGDMRAIEKAGIGPIDLVAVNLYPFRQTVAKPAVTVAEAIEQIDIGGPTLLRAAAKNHVDVVVLCDPEDYPEALEILEDGGAGEDSARRRRRLAAKVYAHTATYDAAVASYLDSLERQEEATPPEALLSLVRVQELRYGENPDQSAAFYRDAARRPWGIAGLKQLHGKELSYNNLLDVDGALAAIAPYLADARAACAIVKHTTPCGLAVGRSTAVAFERALACDPVSAFGSTVAFNQPMAETVAEALYELFVECLIAPGYAEGALRILTQKKNLRILMPEDGELRAYPGHLVAGLDARGVQGGLLLQSAPVPVNPAALQEQERMTVRTRREPSPEEWDDLGFAWAAVQAVKSNAILLAREGATIGIGAGQMSRVDAVKLSGWKAEDAGHGTEGAVLASDAFFPFRDGIDAAAELGVRAIIQPGGSIRDDEVVAAADEHGIAMVMSGRRLFRH